MEGKLLLGRSTKIMLFLYLELKTLDERLGFLQCCIAVSNMSLEGCLQLPRLSHQLLNV